MKCNIGMIDRLLRAAIGLILVIWGIMSGVLWGYAGIILIVTAAMRFCPFYPIFGINTGCDAKHKE